MTEAIKEKKRVFDFINNLHQIAEREGWVFRYDPETDEASVTTPKLPEDSRIRYVNDELALYFSNNKIQGLFIEYFSHNFIEHQPEGFEDLKTLVKQPSHDGLVEVAWSKVEKIAPDFEDAIRLAMVKDIPVQS